jgi:hypothetical protein
MNLRISNLSLKKKLKICATHSADPFNNIAMDTATDAMLPLIPNESKIEGTLNLMPSNPMLDDVWVTLATDGSGKNVIVTTTEHEDVVIGLHQNIVIEWNGLHAEVSGY